MTLYEDLSLLVSGAGFLTVLISLFLVYRQTRIFAQQAEYLAKSLTNSVSESANNLVQQITRLFIEYPEMRPYFYKGKAIEESHPDYDRAEAIAEIMLDIFWTMSRQVERNFPKGFGHPEGRNMWLDYVGDCFVQSPLLVKVLTERQPWYGAQMVKDMNMAMERVRQREQQMTEKQPPAHSN